MQRQKSAKEIASWIEKDITLKKITPGMRLTPDDTKANILLNREFFSQMRHLSNERYKKVVQYEKEQEHFLKIHQTKIQTKTSEMLPPIEPAINRRKLSRTNSILPSVLSTTPKPAADRLARLSLPKSQRNQLKEHVRFNQISPSNPEDIFHELRSVLNEKSTSPRNKNSKNPTDDQRFYKLIETFSNHHQPSISNRQTIQNIIRSNSSLYSERPNKSLAARYQSGLLTFQRLIKDSQVSIISIDA